MVQSCHTTLIEEADFKDIQKNAYPIVVCYNGRDHFTPMRPSSQSKFLKRKLNKELGPIVSAALLVIEELDRSKLSPAVLTAVNQLEDTIVQTLPKISPTSLSSHLKAVAARNKAGPLHRGPVLQPGGEQVSSSDANLALDPASTSANPLSLPDTDQPAEEPPVRRRGPKKYVCHHCGVVKPREPDLTGHLWKVHREGEPKFVKGHLVLGKVSVPELPLKSMWKASIRNSGPTNAKIATMAPELRPTMLNTVFPNMVPGW